MRSRSGSWACRSRSRACRSSNAADADAGASAPSLTYRRSVCATSISTRWGACKPSVGSSMRSAIDRPARSRAAIRPPPTRRARSPRVALGSDDVGGAPLQSSHRLRAQPLKDLLPHRTIERLADLAQHVIGHRDAFQCRPSLQPAMKLNGDAADLHHRVRHDVSMISSVYHVNAKSVPCASTCPDHLDALVAVEP